MRPALVIPESLEPRRRVVTLASGLWGIAMAMALLAGPAGAADKAPPTALGLSCSACHRPTAASTLAIPDLSTLPAARIANALRGYRSGERKGTVMPRIAQPLSDAEIDAIVAETAGR